MGGLQPLVGGKKKKKGEKFHTRKGTYTGERKGTEGLSLYRGGGGGGSEPSYFSIEEGGEKIDAGKLSKAFHPWINRSVSKGGG